MTDAKSHRTVLTDGGRGQSSQPLEDSDCAVRALSLVTGLTYDEAWDELAGAGREPLDGFEWQDWARKVGYIQAPWTGKPLWYFRYVSTEARKGFPRIKPRDIPTVFGKGAWVMSTEGHVEAWIDGRHYDSNTALSVLNPKRTIFGAYECRRLAKDQHLYMASRVYFHAGPQPEGEDVASPKGRICYMSALGPVPGTTHHAAYALASEWYEHKIGGHNSDLIVERI